MNIVETALIYVGTPVGATAVLAAAVYGRTAVAQNRYRPGRPWTYDPVWFVGNPSRFHPASAPTAVPAHPGPTVAASGTPDMGGASGEW